MARNRLQIDIPAVTLRKLILWAASRGEKKNTWARIVLALKCEENQQKVENWLKTESERLGVSQRELEESILSREGFDFDQYRIELLGDGNESND